MYLLILFLLHLVREEPIIVSRETTYITKPLGADGLPDYEKYAFSLYREGVTPDNNAAALLFQAIWPDELQRVQYDIVRAELGLKKIPSSDTTLQPLFGDANQKRFESWRLKQHLNDEELDLEDFVSPAIDHLWKSKQFPPLAEWIDANKRPLDMIVEASRRPRFYSPSPALLNNRRDLLKYLRLPGSNVMREAANGLAIRAMRHVGEDRLNEAWTDVLAIHRLARLESQGHTLQEQYLAMSISVIACEDTLNLLSNDHIAMERANQIKNDLMALSKVSHVAESVSNMEHPRRLDFFVHKRSLAGLDFSRMPDDLLRYMVLKLMFLDWNIVLSSFNHWHDRATDFLQMSDRDACKKAFKAARSEGEAMESHVIRPVQMIGILLSTKARSEFFGADMGIALILDFSDAANYEDEATTTLKLTQLAASLGEFRAKHHAYPAKLDELVPAVIDKLPVDVYHSKPFMYKRDGNGYLLYSTGENGVDDGGNNESLELLAGRSLKDFGSSDSEKPELDVPKGADDISVRVPRPPFKLPKIDTPANTNS